MYLLFIFPGLKDNKKNIMFIVCKKIMCVFTRTEQHSSLHSLQCILLTVLSRVSATGQLVHSTVQQRPLQSHKLRQPFNMQTM